MRIRRILTNNALVVLDENGKEQIVCGRGIGYKKRPGDDADDSLVDAVYVKEGDQSFEQIRKTLEALPEEYLLLAQHILTAANVSLNMKLNPVMAVSLADHLYYAIQRFLEGTPIANSLSWEIRRFYQKEYEVGLMALDMVESQFKVRLPEAEAAFIAMHIANGETDDSTMEETFAITKIIEDICNIVRVYFRIEMDVESSYYYRFITHLKYFARRVVRQEQYEDSSSEELAEIIFDKYREAYQCACKIGEYISRKYHYQLKGGEFFTPSKVSELAAALVDPQENDRIYDPTCGSGGLLLKACKRVPDGKVAVYGQELNAQTWALCKMNMFLHEVDDARIWQGDTLSNPQNVENDNLMLFQCIVANPPFSLDKWDSGFLSNAVLDAKGKKPEKMNASLDPWGRFDWGVPPSSKGDYAFVLHMLNSLDHSHGRMAVVLPHGVLFRGASEGKIRRQIVEHNLLDAVIGLPANLFYGTGIPACILVFRKDRISCGVDNVLFIDASAEGNFEKGKNQNLLRDTDIQKIVDTYKKRETTPKYSYRATLDEIRENDYNLNIPRYVDTFEEEVPVDIQAVKKNIADIEVELAQVQEQMKKYLDELGL